MTSTFRTAIIALFASVLLAAPVHAASQYDTLKAGPAVGAKIPHDLKTVDHLNQHRDFRTLAHKRGLVILFSRSLDW
tara:strand:- start:1481 stop:1711 length:231 start_codon:yes stop_codon:yes gene_type:complete